MMKKFEYMIHCNIMIGYIYKLVKEGDDHIYIGSTIETLEIRLTKHKTKSKKCSERKVYKYILENGGWENWCIKLLEEYTCENETELRIKEEEYRKNQNQSLLLNFCKSYTGLNEKEYRQEYNEKYKTKILEKCKEYRVNHKDEYKEYYKKYREENKEVLALKDKEKYVKNKEKIKKYQKEYAKANKEQISEKRKEKIDCDICGLSVRKADIQRHQRSTKCLEYKEIHDFINN